MTGLILEIQSDALNPEVPVASILRKAKAASIKLRLEIVHEWIESELNGYDSELETPDYRKVHGQVKFLNPYHGWMPLYFDDPELEAAITRFPVKQSAGSLEETVASSEGSGFLTYNFPGSAQRVLADLVGYETQFQLQFNVALARGIVEAVRNRILDWALELESSGIVGEGLNFSPREQELAQWTSESNVYNIQNVGVLGDVRGSNKIRQKFVTFTSKDLQELQGLARQIREIEGVFGNDLDCELEVSAKNLEAEAKKDEPDHNVIRKILASIKSICEGASGNLVANGILSALEKFV